MKICIFNVTSTIAPIGSEEIGGVEIYTFRLAEMLVSRGHEVVVYGGKSIKDFDLPFPDIRKKLFPYSETKQIPNLGTRFQRLIQRILFAFSSKEEFLKENFEAVIIFKPYDFISSWYWRMNGFRSKIIASLHGKEFFLADSFFAKAVDDFYAVSENTSEVLSQRYKQTFTAIPNFINTEKFRAPETTLKQNKLIVSVGRLVEMKGMGVLLKAFNRVRVNHPEAQLVLIGDGPEREALEKFILQNGLQKFVTLAGIQSESQILEYLRRCWVYVQPSVGSESFSISTLEAFAAGCSVIASNQVHIANIFNSDNAAEIYSSEEPEALEKLLLKLLSEDQDTLKARGKRAQSIVEQKFSSEQVINQIEGLLVK
jgi:glycosyltransferase involved in cell wall biosynthesis